jgi:hypothetical protein
MKLERWHVIQRAIDREYDVHSIWPCFVGFVHGDVWEVDVNHPAYPRARGPEPEPVVKPMGEGPGTELKKLLKFFGIEASEGCACNQRAIEMNDKGVEWCAENVDVIVGWLHEEAAKRSLPFSHLAASLLVRRAISNARKANNK